MRVGEYTLLTRIGEGGMGVVHLAQKPGGDRVALKVLRPHIVGDDEARHRLAREVNSLSRIRSPRVAEIVDADPWGDIPYVATRYVPGLALHDHTQAEGPIEGADLLWFATCLAEALAAVHAVGVLHRDIKPANVLMEGRSPVLIDFGLARVADDPRLTHIGWLLGTPGYLAPEILHGEDATTAADVHSWAATVAYAGTGRSPFGRGPSMAIMDRVRRGEHDLSGLPDALRSALAAALDPDAGRRPTLDALRQWLHQQVPAARRSSPPSRPAPDVQFTQPLAVAAQVIADAPTRAFPGDTETVAVEVPTRALPVDQSVPVAPTGDSSPEHAPYRAPPQIQPTPAPRVAFLERARRASLVAAGAVAAGAALTAYPYLTTLGLALLVWLLRSGSLAGSAAQQRRQFRGSKWYDAVQVVFGAPWHLVLAIPGTIMLVFWGLGLAVAAGLLCFAFAVGLEWTIFGCGVVLAVSLWCGPGGSRVRSPLRRLVDPTARVPLAWLATMVLVFGVTAALFALVAEQGIGWAPAQGGPLAPGSALRSLVNL